MTKYTVIGRTSPACKYCDKAKTLLDAKGIEYEFIDLSGNAVAIKLLNVFGYSTIPLIIDEDGCEIGGYDDLFIYFEEDPAA